jgi:hypothetical protein
MKWFLAPILLLTLLFPAIAFGETVGDLVVRDGLWSFTIKMDSYLPKES